MLKKEQLLKINELKSPAKIEKMDDERYAEYCSMLRVFIEGLPAQEESLKHALASGDYDSLCITLGHISNILKLIYADGLAENCIKLSDDVKTVKREVIEAYLTYLLTTLSMLSIDIQMAEHDDEKSAFIAEPALEVIPEENKQTKSILAVDDVSLVLNGLKSILQGTEYKFTGVASGEMALRYLAGHSSPDLFILDIEMPKMDGYELAREIRELGHTSPIIFLTGNATQDYVLGAIQAGAADFIVKPVNKDSVLEKIAKFIG